MEGHRANYIARCIERLVPMEAHILQFARSPWDIDNLKQLAEHFHQIAGSAGCLQPDRFNTNCRSPEKDCVCPCIRINLMTIIIYWP